MALLSINGTDSIDRAELGFAVQALPPRAPVVVMIHGFKFCPDRPQSDPHRHILSLDPAIDCWKAISWPRHLGLGGDAGLGIAFGWSARGSIWRAWRASSHAARRLSRLLALLYELDPDRPVHLVGHSLGARVALAALPGLPPGAVQRLILISAALFRAESARLVASPAGRAAEVLNVTGRENALFDILLRLALPLAGPTVGHRGPEQRNWLDLALDRPGNLAAFRALGHRIAPPKARVCHWSGYLRPGVWRFYKALLLTPERLPLDLLRGLVDRPEAATPPETARSPLRLNRA
ncbi:alpha/beta fold hydrolase [Pelagovum pacificum]|uniref:Alpha/beta fold hydrolase n=1 Tax=Pelagovum pacificum TaxID=2588711 RepID=A0A5C5GEJ5_9RHOB|nr:alpha/beta fold hydrolase [Pelagovum pacificum]QQA43711.1 alpha/beta fold hydrolase [Pelagovum pacificum]TNY33158.1 alpha/beta fold hydrolase [Pelagovum pacificum]